MAGIVFFAFVFNMDENDEDSNLAVESLVGLIEVMDGIIAGLAEIDSILKSEV